MKKYYEMDGDSGGVIDMSFETNPSKLSPQPPSGGKTAEEVLKRHYEYIERLKVLGDHIGEKEFYTIGHLHNSIDEAMQDWAAIVSAGKDARIKELEGQLASVIEKAKAVQYAWDKYQSNR